MTDQDFFAQMQIGIPHIPSPAAPAAVRCECDHTNHHVCDDCDAVDRALKQHGANH